MSTSVFFYGTLLHPEVLSRVLGKQGDNLEVAPAVLLGFTRHHIKGCDYPAIVPYTSAQSLFQRELSQEEKSVRGTVVSGLTRDELKSLDIFEGDEFVRQAVSVCPLASFSPLLASIRTLIKPMKTLPQLQNFIEVQIYIWNDRLDRLVPEPWSFDIFVQEKLWRWVGRYSSDNADYAIVNERRALDGIIKSSHPKSTLDVSNGPPEFGHGLLSQFLLHKDYVNLNSGSYGCVPRPVSDVIDALSLEIESRPDKFLRRTYYGPLKTARKRLAGMLGADTDEVVMVPNATHGISTILRNIIWSRGDVIVRTTTTYGSISRSIQYIHDLPPHPALSVMALTFPTTHAAILDQFRQHLRAIPRKRGQKVVAVIDAIVANPGCVMPWEGMVAICKEENVWSIIDAAHSIGQQVDINLGKADPDFWVSNCHKWLFAKRPCAVLYVPRRNQHIIQSTIPTSWHYVSSEDRESPHTPKAPNFVAQFEWTGTIDMAPFLSVNAALDFREKLGGEARINEYCHGLAIKGGKRLAQLLQTSVMPEELTANMTNVALPLSISPSFPEYELTKLRERMESKLLEEWDCFVAVFIHDGKWWARCSAQVWNELSDFEYVAKALSTICLELGAELDI